MRTHILLSALAVCGVASLKLDALDTIFNHYLAEYGKSYATKEEYLARKELFKKQIEMVSHHNAQNGVSYQVGLNKFSDLTDAEFSTYLGDSGQPENYELIEQITERPPLMQAAPTPIDWRDKGIVGAVKDQAACGSCWSFSTIGPIEEHYAIKYGKQILLAEQQLVDCSWPYGNQGCQGGLYANGYAYCKDYGVMLQTDYPYMAADQACSYDQNKVAVKIRGTISAIRSAEGLKQALMNGPASISLNATEQDFRNYKTGIYNNAACPTGVNHAVQSVGWGTEGGVNYFIVRNSWGAKWGDQGYIKIAETNTDLGICGMLYRVPMQPIIV